MPDTLKQKAAYKRFRRTACKAFPAEKQADVEAVLDRLSTETSHCDKEIFALDALRFVLPDSEDVCLPYRIYLKRGDIDPDMLAALTPEQALIYHCLFSRSHSGYERQTHIAALLRAPGSLPDWCFPFLLFAGGDYVVEILQELSEGLRRRRLQERDRLGAFCRLNLQAFLYLHARMISYWSCFYRDRWYRYEDYVGKRLFHDGFGYTRCLEKERRRFTGKESHPYIYTPIHETKLNGGNTP